MVLEIPFVILGVYITTNYNSRLLASLLFRFTHEKDDVVWWLSLFFLPGVFLHEVSHLVIAEFLLLRTDNLTLVPHITEDGKVKLGGVSVQKSDPLRRSIVGLAPFILGVIILWTATYYLDYFYQAFGLLVAPVYIYITIQITHTMFSSRKDMEGFLWGLISAVIVYFFLRWMVSVIQFDLLERLLSSLNFFLKYSSIYLVRSLRYSLLVDIVFFFILLFLNRIRR